MRSSQHCTPSRRTLHRKMASRNSCDPVTCKFRSGRRYIVVHLWLLPYAVCCIVIPCLTLSLPWVACHEGSQVDVPKSGSITACFKEIQKDLAWSMHWNANLQHRHAEDILAGKEWAKNLSGPLGVLLILDCTGLVLDFSVNINSQHFHGCVPWGNISSKWVMMIPEQR